jgi:hypothetical protein
VFLKSGRQIHPVHDASQQGAAVQHETVFQPGCNSFQLQSYVTQCEGHFIICRRRSVEPLRGEHVARMGDDKCGRFWL